MALERKDSVADTSTTTGTGTFTLAGSAPLGRLTFTASGLTTGATVRYRIALADESEWEVGEGVWTTSGATLSRVTVYASSNSGSLVNFSAGSKNVALVLTVADLTRPVFRAHRASTQTVTASTFVKVQLNVVGFDTAGGFDATTNYRYTATVPGYYLLTGQVATATAATRFFTQIYKNGAAVANGSDATAYRAVVSDVVYLNGTTDYVELWVYSSNTALASTTATDIYLAGALIAPA